MLAIISDIHSNYEALTTVYRWLDANRIDEVICLGDVVGYGPEPNIVCDLVRQRCKVTLLGNHDAAVIGGAARRRERCGGDRGQRGRSRAPPVCANDRHDAHLSPLITGARQVTVAGR
jgi:hypothetical protein